MPKRLGSALIAFLVASGIYLSGGLDRIEYGLMDTRFDLFRRDATGGLVVIAIDPTSLARLDTWPWPRGHHARLIDRLTEAGVRTIALDIDFSSRSSEVEDAALADAIRRSGGRVVLPVFRQRTGVEEGETRMTGPLAEFERHATLASVTVRPESDGLMRHAPVADGYRGRAVPSLPALLAGRSEPATESFYVDYGIRPTSLPMLSYADVLDGDFDPKALAGKTAIVGATAVELGDMFAVPLHRTLPGVVVQALAYESLVQGRDIQRAGPGLPLAASFLIAFALAPLFVRRSWRGGALAVLGTSGAALAASAALQQHQALGFDASPCVLTAVLCFAVHVVGEVESQTRELFRQGVAVLTKGATLSGIVEDSFDGIAVTDETGTIEMFNRAAGDMLGCDPEDAIGRPIAELLPLGSPLADSEAGEASIPVEIDVENRDGGAVTIELVRSVSTVRVGRARSERDAERRRILIFTFRDVTDRKRTREAQRQAMEEAMAANRAKSEFIANMSHELRTPLNAVIGFSTMIKDQVMGPLGSPRYAEYAADILSSGTHLLGIVNDILDVSKIEAGKLEISEELIEIEPIAASCLRFVSRHAEERRIKLVSAVPADLPALHGDERLIKQIVANLLSNAVKFTPEGGSVSLEAAREADGSIAIVVRDTGIGIAPENIPNLGKPFFQADTSTARTHDGTGLGLYLVAKFVALHGGTVDYESAPGQGTTVTVRLPAARVSEPDWASITAAVA